MISVAGVAHIKLHQLIMNLALNEVDINSFGEELKKILSSLEKEMLDIAHLIGSSGQTTESSLANFM